VVGGFPRRAGGLLELHAQAVTQLRPGLLGEGHGGDVTKRHAVVEHRPDHPPDERLGLAGPCAGLHEQRRAQVRADGLTSSVVRQRSHHGHDPASSTWPSSGASPGSTSPR
jgi:hypothetical protein